MKLPVLLLAVLALPLPLEAQDRADSPLDLEVLGRLLDELDEQPEDVVPIGPVPESGGQPGPSGVLPEPLVEDYVLPEDMVPGAPGLRALRAFDEVAEEAPWLFVTADIGVQRVLSAFTAGGDFSAGRLRHRCDREPSRLSCMGAGGIFPPSVVPPAFSAEYSTGGLEAAWGAAVDLRMIGGLYLGFSYRQVTVSYVADVEGVFPYVEAAQFPGTEPVVEFGPLRRGVPVRARFYAFRAGWRLSVGRSDLFVAAGPGQARLRAVQVIDVDLAGVLPGLPLVFDERTWPVDVDPGALVLARREHQALFFQVSSGVVRWVGRHFGVGFELRWEPSFGIDPDRFEFSDSEVVAGYSRRSLVWGYAPDNLSGAFGLHFRF